MYKELRLGLSIVLISLLIQPLVASNYVLSSNDLNVVVSSGQHTELLYNIPITITPLTEENDDLFVVASYGGLKEKTSQQFELGSLDANAFEAKEIEMLSRRVLRDGDESVPYQLLANPRAISEIQLVDQVVSEDDVLPIYEKDRFNSFSEIRRELLVKVSDAHMYRAGTYSDIFTIYLYKGRYTDSDPELIASTQVQVTLQLPSYTRIKYSEKSKIWDEKVLDLSWSFESNQSSTIQLKRDGEEPIHIHMPFSENSIEKQLEIKLSDDEITNKEVIIQTEIKDR